MMLKTDKGTLFIENLPENAQVLVDGEQAELTIDEETMIAKTVLSEGEYQVEVSIDGSVVQGESVTISTAGENRVVFRNIQADSVEPSTIEDTESMSDTFPGPRNVGAEELLFQPEFERVEQTGFSTLGPFSIENGLLIANGQKGNAISRDDYQDFELLAEWRLGPSSNSGIYYRSPPVTEVEFGNEYALVTDTKADPVPTNQKTASLFGVMHPRVSKNFPPYTWHSSKIICVGKNIEHWLDGQLMLSYAIDGEDFIQAVSRNVQKRERRELVGLSIPGRILLQSLAGQVAFRKVSIRRIQEIQKGPSEDKTVSDTLNDSAFPISADPIAKPTKRVPLRELHSEDKKVSEYKVSDTVFDAVAPRRASSISADMTPHDLLTSEDYEWSEPRYLGLFPYHARDLDRELGDFLLAQYSAVSKAKNAPPSLCLLKRNPGDSQWRSVERLNISSTTWDWNPSLSRDGLHLAFQSNRAGGKSPHSDIWFSRRETLDSPWSKPAINFRGSTKNRDESPCFAENGLAVYFNSARFKGKEGTSLVVTRRPHLTARWLPAEELGPKFNVGLYSTAPVLSEDDRVLIFATRGNQKSGERRSLWMSTREEIGSPWSQPSRLDDKLSLDGQVMPRMISPDGQTLVMKYVPQGAKDPAKVGTWVTHRVKRSR
ncbi:3-keto-disaccharide hydrolase [Rhodopirellula sallentina]|uniref:Protein containing DUF1080 n=1 Tax=Rhodopirellula sallentina SM41 TaxID=1263870 RepID=M5UJA4_9BACT|nr:DUF1080 domain-containing protein [Rhodopirellula sallentina]EMI57926.1 protein containing DUF1080 [Rhodopirellula sallentina SM41]